MASRAKPAKVPGAGRLANLLTVDVQLRVELLHLKPLVWRRLIVPETVTLAKLHTILIAGMGWGGGHLHEYEIGRVRYGREDPDYPSIEPVRDERRYRLATFVEERVKRFTWLYDFGDDWEHRIVLEDLHAQPQSGQRIRCVAGENACPPEDVGGVGGYLEFLEAITDPRHEQHADMLEWIGYPFDPKAFNLTDINEWLAGIKP